MVTLRFNEVELAYRGQRPVLRGVSIHLRPGWTGVVGENGAGKSTLLALAAGELCPSAGSIARSPADAQIARCPQVSTLDDEVRACAASDDHAARRWRAQLGCDPDELHRWDTLSPGERKRWQLAAALAREPEGLLLDEPTNHLDARTRAHIEDALRAFGAAGGLGLLVSHDRGLLSRLCHSIARVHRGQVRLYRGDYDDARAQWEAEAAERRTERAQAAEHARAATRRLAAARQQERQTQRSTYASARMRSVHDSDARSIGAGNLAQWAATAAGRKVARLARTEREAKDRVAALEVERERGGAMFIDWEPPPRRVLAALDGVELRAGDTLLARDVRCAITRTSRVHLAGENGAGKTTLLRALVAAAQVPAQRLLWLPQELGEDLASTAATTGASSAAHLLAELRALPPAERGRLGQLAATLGLDPARALASPCASPGEVRKLALAAALARRAWLLVLDEPTNHLDLPSIERLEAALAAYPGALLLVSHDDELAARVTDERWHISEVLRAADARPRPARGARPPRQGDADG